MFFNKLILFFRHVTQLQVVFYGFIKFKLFFETLSVKDKTHTTFLREGKTKTVNKDYFI